MYPKDAHEALKLCNPSRCDKLQSNNGFSCVCEGMTTLAHNDHVGTLTSNGREAQIIDISRLALELVVNVDKYKD